MSHKCVVKEWTKHHSNNNGDLSKFSKNLFHVCIISQTPIKVPTKISLAKYIPKIQ